MMRRIKVYNSEDMLHQQVTDYLRLQYPKVLFRTDFAAGIKMTPGQAIKHKRLQGGYRAWPDLFIAKPCIGMNGPNYHGLFIELKKQGTKILKCNGQLLANKHLQEQHQTLEYLNNLGYRAVFGVGFDETKKIIDQYLSGGVYDITK